MSVKNGTPLLCFLFLLCASAVRAESDADLAAKLRAEDEKLLVAVHRGGRAVWDAATTGDFVYVEEGEVVPRADFLRGLEEDGAEPLVLREFQVHRSGDTAIVLHTDDLPARDQAPRAGGRYLMTETWQRIEGVWKLRIVHVDAVHTDPPAVTLNPGELDRLTGTYRSGEERIVVRRDGDSLIRHRTGRPDRELKAEARDVFYVPGQTRVRSIFQRDASGAVISLVIRDENSDRVWERVAGPEN